VAVDSIFKFFSFFYSHKEPLWGKVAIILIPERNNTHINTHTLELVEKKKKQKEWCATTGVYIFRLARVFSRRAFEEGTRRETV